MGTVVNGLLLRNAKSTGYEGYGVRRVPQSMCAGDEGYGFFTRTEHEEYEHP